MQLPTRNLHKKTRQIEEDDDSTATYNVFGQSKHIYYYYLLLSLESTTYVVLTRTVMVSNKIWPKLQVLMLNSQVFKIAGAPVCSPVANKGPAYLLNLKRQTY